MQKEFNLELMYTTFEEINRFFCDALLVVILMLQMLEIVVHGNAQVAFWQVDVDRPWGKGEEYVRLFLDQYITVLPRSLEIGTFSNKDGDADGKEQ